MYEYEFDAYVCHWSLHDRVFSSCGFFDSHQHTPCNPNTASPQAKLKRAEEAVASTEADFKAEKAKSVQLRTQLSEVQFSQLQQESELGKQVSHSVLNCCHPSYREAQHIHTHTRTHTHAHTHTCTRTYVHTYIRTCIHAYMHTHTYTQNTFSVTHVQYNTLTHRNVHVHVATRSLRRIGVLARWKNECKSPRHERVQLQRRQELSLPNMLQRTAHHRFPQRLKSHRP